MVMPKYKRYNEQEIQFIKENHLKLTYKEIAIELERPIKSLTSKIHDIGITKPVIDVATVKLGEYERGWIEALIDGEGCLTIARKKSPTNRSGYTLAPILRVSNTCIALLERAKAVCLGRGCVSNYNKQKAYQARKPCYDYIITGNTLRWLLPQIRLIVKEKQRQLLLESLEIRAKVVYNKRGLRQSPYNDGDLLRLNELKEEVSRLNKKGRN